MILALLGALALQPPAAFASCGIDVLRTAFDGPIDLDHEYQLAGLTTEYQRKYFHLEFQNCVKTPSLCQSVFEIPLLDHPPEVSLELKALEVEALISKKAVSEWITTPERAVYVINRLHAHPDVAFAILRELKNHPVLKDAIRPKFASDALLGFSLEKERLLDKEVEKGVIVNYYKLPRYTDEEWLAKPRAERAEALKEALRGERPTVPTALKPAHLANLKWEVLGAFEITHHTYEVSLEKLFEQYDQLVAETGSDAIHTHLTFHLPLDYPQKHFEAFTHWEKHVGDYMIFQMMEQGFLPSRFTTALTKKLTGGGGFVDSRFLGLPATLNDINKSGYKLGVMGTRSTIYGPDLPGWKRIGLEPRDFARDPAIYKHDIRNLAESIRDEAWLRPDHSVPEFAFERLEDSERMADLTTAGIKPKLAKILVDYNIGAEIPLQQFENGVYHNYRTGETVKLTEAQKTRIASARQNYLAKLKRFGTGVWGFLNPSSETPNIGRCRRFLGEWAREARISELYSQF